MSNLGPKLGNVDISTLINGATDHILIVISGKVYRLPASALITPDEVSSLQATDHVMVEIGGALKRIPASYILQPNGFKGKALTATDPGAATAGDWWQAGENGTYTNFGNQAANYLDVFRFDGTNWILFANEGDLFKTFKESDPDDLANPATGSLLLAANNGKLYTKNAEGKQDILATQADIASDAWYGFRLTIGQTATTVTSIGRADLQASKPVSSAIYPAIIKEDGSEAYKLDTLDITKKLDQVPSVLTGEDGDAMTVIPEYYWKAELSPDQTYIDFKFSQYNLIGFTRIPKHAKGIWKAYKNPTTGKLQSISGVMPTVSLTRDAFRQAARAKTAHPGWCIEPYFIREADFFLWVAESLNLNSQESIGAGATNANGTDWSFYNGYHPVWQNGEGNNALIRTGQIPVSIPDFVGNTVVGESFTSNFDVAVALLHSPIRSGSVTVGAYVEGTDYTIDYTAGTITVLSTGTMADATSYTIDYTYLTALSTNIATLWWMRDVFGHIWEFVDGININNDAALGSRAFISKIISSFADNIDIDYIEAGQLAESDGYISKLVPGTILPVKGMPAGTSSQHVGDYYYTYYDNDPTSGWRVALWGGVLNTGSAAGLCNAVFHLSSGVASANVGARLCLVY